MTADLYREERPYATRFCVDPVWIYDFRVSYGRFPTGRKELEAYLRHRFPNAWKDCFLPDLTQDPESASAVVHGQLGGTGGGYAVTVKAGR